MIDLVIGVDGGGTRCRARARTRDGALLGEGEAGAANLATDPQGSRRAVVEAARAALHAGGLGDDALARALVAAALAGANLPSRARSFAALDFPFGDTVLLHDAAAACRGAHAEEDGVVAVLGTGTAYTIQVAGAVRTIGGWGFLLSDEGSGADLGRSAMHAALLAHDGAGARSAMTDAVLARFQGDPERMSHFAAHEPPGAFGALAPFVFDCAEEGDAVAASILHVASERITAHIDALLGERTMRLTLMGGMAKRYAPRLPERLRRLLAPAKADPMEGAIQLAQEHAAELA